MEANGSRLLRLFRHSVTDQQIAHKQPHVFWFEVANAQTVCQGAAAGTLQTRQRWPVIGFRLPRFGNASTRHLKRTRRCGFQRPLGSPAVLTVA